MEEEVGDFQTQSRKRASVSFKTQESEAITVPIHHRESDGNDSPEHQPQHDASGSDHDDDDDEHDMPQAVMKHPTEPNMRRAEGSMVKATKSTPTSSGGTLTVSPTRASWHAGTSRLSVTPSNAIKVAVRIRPMNSQEKAYGETQVVLPTSEKTLNLINPIRGDSKPYTFDRVFHKRKPEGEQETIMQELGTDLVNSCMQGYNSCLFAYGQTGSGKTHTVLGNENPPENRGLLPRIVEALFEEIELAKMDATEKNEFSTSVSYLEIYNETIHDLLAPEESRGKLEVRHHPKLGAFVPGLTDTPVFSWADVNRLMEFGVKARAVGATAMNEASSRSHCIFWLETTRKVMAKGKMVNWRSKLNLVDLAGSERQKRTLASGDQLKEGAMINKSLSSLALIVSKLAEQCNGRRRKSDIHIPFRNSKLTFLLQESLCGNSATTIIAAASPAGSSHEETMGTLNFAQNAKAVRTQMKKNEEVGTSLVEELEKECERLQQMVEAGKSDRQELSDLMMMKEKYGRDLEQQLALANTLSTQRNRILEDAGLTTKDMNASMGLGEHTPQLLNVCYDPQLNNCLVYFLQKDQEILVGEDTKCQIWLTGTGMEPVMAKLRNVDGQSISLEHVSGRVLLNGRQVSGEDPVYLLHNDRLILGFSYCFRLVIPSKAQDCHSDDRGMWQRAMDEVQPEQGSQFEHSLFVRELESTLGEVRAKVFLNGFRKVSLQVEEANALIKEVHPESSLRFGAEVVMDLTTTGSKAPECIVRLKKESRGADRLRHFVEKHYLKTNLLQEALEELRPRMGDDATETVHLLPVEEFRHRLHDFQVSLKCTRRRCSRSSFSDFLPKKASLPSGPLVDPWRRFIGIGNEADHEAALAQANDSIVLLQDALSIAEQHIRELEAERDLPGPSRRGSAASNASSPSPRNSLASQAAATAAAEAAAAAGNTTKNPAPIATIAAPAPSLAAAGAFGTPLDATLAAAAATTLAAAEAAAQAQGQLFRGLQDQAQSQQRQAALSMGSASPSSLPSGQKSSSSNFIGPSLFSLTAPPLGWQATLAPGPTAGEEALTFSVPGAAAAIANSEPLPSKLEVQSKLLAQVRKAFEEGRENDIEEKNRLKKYTERLQARESQHLKMYQDVRTEVKSEAKRLFELPTSTPRASLEEQLRIAQAELAEARADSEVALEMAEFYMRTGHHGREEESQVACVNELLGRIQKSRGVAGTNGHRKKM